MKTEVILKYPLQMLFSVFSLSLPWILAIPQYTFDVKLSTLSLLLIFLKEKILKFNHLPPTTGKFFSKGYYAQEAFDSTGIPT